MSITVLIDRVVDANLLKRVLQLLLSIGLPNFPDDRIPQRIAKCVVSCRCVSRGDRVLCISGRDLPGISKRNSNLALSFPHKYSE